MKRRSIFLTLCIALLALPLVTGFIFCVREWRHHERMEKALEKSLLQKITVRTSDIIWIKKGKEILYQNQYFDIKAARSEGENTIFTGLFDEVEKRLKKEAGLMGKSGFPIDKSRVYKLFLLGLFHVNNLSPDHFSGAGSGIRYYPVSCSSCPEGSVLPPTPPPRMSS